MSQGGSTRVWVGVGMGVDLSFIYIPIRSRMYIHTHPHPHPQAFFEEKTERRLATAETEYFLVPISEDSKWRSCCFCRNFSLDCEGKVATEKRRSRFVSSRRSSNVFCSDSRDLLRLLTKNRPIQLLCSKSLSSLSTTRKNTSNLQLLASSLLNDSWSIDILQVLLTFESRPHSTPCN